MFKSGGPSGFEKRLGVEASKYFDQRRHQSGPSCLMAGADTSAVVAMEIFVEQQVILPVQVALKLLGTAKYRSSARLIA